MTDKEAMQQALEHLDRVMSHGSAVQEAKNILSERLAQPEQDPVCAHGIGKTKCSFCHQPQPEQEPVAHTLNCVCGAVWDVSPDGVEEMVHAPNPPQRKPLTDEEILHRVDTHVGGPSPSYPLDNSDWLNFARAIEAKLKEKNT